jgi:hypothetical protein
MEKGYHCKLPADHPDLVRRYRLPNDKYIEAEDRRRVHDAAEGSFALLRAMRRAGA